MKLNLRNVIQEKICKNVWDIECKLTYHDTKAVIYMNEYTMNLIESIMTRELTMYAKDISDKEDNGIMGTYEGTDKEDNGIMGTYEGTDKEDNGIMCTYEGTEIIIKNELKDFEIEITEKEN